MWRNLNIHILYHRKGRKQFVNHQIFSQYFFLSWMVCWCVGESWLSEVMPSALSPARQGDSCGTLLEMRSIALYSSKSPHGALLRSGVCGLLESAIRIIWYVLWIQISLTDRQWPLSALFLNTEFPYEPAILFLHRGQKENTHINKCAQQDCSQQVKGRNICLSTD